MRTQVGIVGAGPAGLLLSHLLHLHGIDSIVVERQSRAYVLARVRAGMLESGTVAVLREAGLSARMDREGTPHDGVVLIWPGRERFILDTRTFTGRQMMAYGQIAITEDLFAARDAAKGQIIDEAQDVTLHGITSSPSITFDKGGTSHRIDCDMIAGCDGFRGISRHSIPTSVLRVYEKAYPFGWLGILSDTPPHPDICYVSHRRGFALASMRGPTRSRYYIQCDIADSIESWPDDRFWEEFKARCPPEMAERTVTGPSIEKSIAQVRSFVAEPMRYGKLFLAGDAAHIVPPTGAKGLNLAVSDVFYLARGFATFFTKNDSRYLDSYSEMALRRIWGAERLCWWMTNLLHRFPDESEFDLRSKENEFEYICSSRHAQASLAEQYAGLPFES